MFPASTYPGVANALGVATLDTTTLANGVHTIAWAVTANNGQSSGIGSRFFTVANGTGAPATAALHAGREPDARTRGLGGLGAHGRFTRAR